MKIMTGNDIKKIINERSSGRKEFSKLARKIIINEIKENILDYWPYMVLIISNDGDILFVNERVTKELGWSSSEMLGINYINFVHPDDVKRTSEVFINFRDKGVKRDPNEPFFINKYKCSDGSYVNVQWFDGVDNIHGMFLCFAKTL